MSVPLLLAVVALASMGAGAWVSHTAGGDAHRRHVVVDGVPLDEVHPRAGGPRPGVVVAHGFAGSARLMTQFGDVLAARGYVVVLLDFSGHGTNTRPLGGDADLQRDLDVAVGHLRGLPDVAGVAVVGHSMGAGAAVRYGAAHPDVAATVAISLPDASDVRPGLPRRLLPLVGGAEFRSFRDAATGAASVGGGHPAVVVPGTEHVSILWAPRTHREVVAWLDGTFGAPTGAAAAPSPLRRLAGAGLLMAGFFLGFVPLARVVVGRRQADGPVGRRRRAPGVGRAVVATGIGSVVAALVAAVVPTAVVPLAIGGYLVVFTTLTGLALAAYAARRGRPAPPEPVPAGGTGGAGACTGTAGTGTAGAGTAGAGTAGTGTAGTGIAGAEAAAGTEAGAGAGAAAGAVGPGGSVGTAETAGPARSAGAAGRGWVRDALAAVVLVVYAGAAIAVPLQVGVVQAVPVGPREWILALIWTGFAILAFGAGRLTDGSGVGLLAVSAVVTVVLTAAAVAGLTSGFVLLVVPLLVVLMVWQSAWAEVLRRRAVPLWAAAPVGALLVAWPVAVTLPLTG